MRQVWLCFLALLLTGLVAVWQRVSGPTWPVRGKVLLPNGEQASFHLPRSGEEGRDVKVFIEVTSSAPSGFVRYRRVPSGDDW